MKLDLMTILTNSVNITVLVLILMMIIEYVNVKTRGAWSIFLEKHPAFQILIAALMGLIPGCLGAFAVVSLYTHRMVTIGAIVAAFITTFGDEAFFMMSLMPLTTLWLSLILLAIAIVVGFVVDFFAKDKYPFVQKMYSFEVHKEHECKHVHLSEMVSPKSISWKRFLFVAVAVLYIVGQLTGVLGHSHEGFGHQHDHAHAEVHQHEHSDDCSHEDDSQHEHHIHSADCDSFHEEAHVHTKDCEHSDEEVHVHSEDCAHGQQYVDAQLDASCSHEEEHSHHAETIMFVLAALVLLVILFRVNGHFVDEHLWNHVVKKHFFKVFLWTFGALLVLGLLFHFFDIESWIDSHKYALLYLLIIALLIGIIPESGPHYVIILLFLNGVVPFSILLANSIVQDGHGGLPLLAETKRGFLLVKGINLLVGLVVGLAGFFMGW